MTTLTAMVLTLLLADSSPIVGPTGGVPGDILVLDASGAKADSYAWAVDRDLPDKRLSLMPLPPDNARCIVASVPGTYIVFCALQLKGKPVALYRWVVVVSDKPQPGPPQPQPPLPNPPPQPVPPTPVPVPPDPPAPKPLPDGRFKLAAFVATEVGKLPAAAKARAPVMAAAFGTLASKIAAGTVAVWQVPIETLTAFNSAAGDQLAAWQPVSKAVQTRLRELAKEPHGIKGLPDLADAYAEIRTGLESIK